MKKFLFVLFIILLNLNCYRNSSYMLPTASSTRIYNGLERFIKTKAYRYKNKKAALITNHSGVNYELKQNISLLVAEGINITTVFAPEHGIYGHQEEYSKKTSKVEKTRNLKIFNMHNLSNDKFSSLLKKNNIVIFDIQDMGMRCYTYISNLKRTMDLLVNSEIELIVLDRPNPIAPFGVDGFHLNPKFKSKYISAFPAPFIYGLTLGEAALYYKGEFLDNLHLTVIPMKNYRKNLFFTETGQPWVPPSPNLPSFRSAIIYTGVVLMEGINLSIGRGTANPFEYIGAPWIEPISLSKALNKLDLKSFKFRPVYFTPKYSKYNNEKCGGVQIFYTGGLFSATEVSFKIINYLIKTYPECKWEKWKKVYNIDYLAGSDIFRKYIIQNKSYADLKKAIYFSRRKYNKRMRNYILYKSNNNY